MKRRFYGFGSNEIVLQHIAQVKTLRDLYQLSDDIYLSGTNLVKFYQSSTVDGIWEIQDLTELSNTKRHLFFTKESWEEIGGLSDEEKALAATITIL
jgi:hypothetical protein